jgi:hypothetical protein
MTILVIEHKVPDFDGWKKAFDSDPMNRKKSGVKHYLIFRDADDPNYVTIHLGFDDVAEARETLKRLQQLWQKIEGTVIFAPKTRILDIVEAVDL